MPPLSPLQSEVDGSIPLELTVAAEEQDLRLDQLVRQRIPGISRGSVERLLERGLVLVDGRPEPKGLRLRPGQRVVVAAVARSERPISQPELPLELIAVLPSLVAINKTAGPPCHPLVPGETDTVANALVARFPECASASPHAREAGLVHRLDHSTSGVLLAARTPQAYGRMRGFFSSGQVEKHYLALVAGAVEGPGRIEHRLRTMPGDGRRMAVLESGDGQEARTEFRPVARLGALTLVEVNARTGRRHQVRVHLAHLGHPLVGDELYGGPAPEGAAGAFLHAHRLAVAADGLALHAALPAERAAVLRRLGLKEPVLDAIAAGESP
jgi:23S rRNA pseudouridine1911/1915/1917 synthase